MDTFFTFIRRINSLLLFGGLVAFTLLVLWGVGSSAKEQNRDVVAIAKTPGVDQELTFRLEEVQNIPGTDTQMLKLTASKTRSGIGYSGYERETRNILFLSGNDKAARWLFPNQGNVIHTAASLLAPADNAQATNKGADALALYFVYSDQGTSGDGEVTKSDSSKLALAKANGEGFTNVLSGIDHLYSVSLVGGRSISILYRVGKSLKHARYAVATLAKEFDREVAAIPGVERSH